jgi:DNA-binding NarL/FixJ family response regulator
MTTAKTEVWLIEDNENYRETVAKVINRLPNVCCPRVFANCEDFFQVIKQTRPPDLLFLDLGLPGIGGIQAIPLIKEAAPATGIIVLTAFDDHDKIFQSICAGALGYLLKTAPISRIGEAIQEALAGGAPLSPQIARSVLRMFSALVPEKKDYGLTKREQEILELMVKGLLLKQIAAELSVSYHTVDSHLRGIYSKLHVQSRSNAVAKAIKEGLYLKQRPD